MVSVLAHYMALALSTGLLDQRVSAAESRNRRPAAPALSPRTTESVVKLAGGSTGARTHARSKAIAAWWHRDGQLSTAAAMKQPSPRPQQMAGT
jgi:hypothetical protein